MWPNPQETTDLVTFIREIFDGNLHLATFWCFYCQLSTYITPFFSVSIVDFEQVNVSCVIVVSQPHNMVGFEPALDLSFYSTFNAVKVLRDLSLQQVVKRFHTNFKNFERMKFC